MQDRRKQPPPWSEHDMSILIRMAAEGHTREEISWCFPDRSRAAVDHKMAKMGLKTSRPQHRQAQPIFDTSWARKVRWPRGVRFEDVTQEEAKAISAGAPRSGRVPQRTYDRPFSIIGNSGAMCVA